MEEEELKEVYDLLKMETPLGSNEIARKLNIHQNTAIKRLKVFMEMGLIHKQGRGPNVRYTL